MDQQTLAADLLVSLDLAPPVAGTGPDRAADDLLRLVADRYDELGASLGRPRGDVPSITLLRETPIGRDIRLLTAVAGGATTADAGATRAAVDRVLAVLPRSAIAVEPEPPEWFWRTEIGGAIAAARFRSHPAGDLVCRASAAERLTIDETTLDRLAALGIIEAIRNETGRPFFSLRAIERMRRVAAEFDAPGWDDDDGCADA